MFTEAKKNAPIVLLYDTVSLFLVLFKVFFIFINVLKSDAPCALSLGRLFQQCTSQISATLMRYAKKCIFKPYMPSVLYVGHRQIAQTQIRRHRMLRLIRVSTVCLHNFLLKLE